MREERVAPQTLRGGTQVTSVSEGAFLPFGEAFPDRHAAGLQIRAARSSARVRGYTLIELLMVMVILTIVASIAFVGLNKHGFDSAYRRYADDLSGSMVRARNLAIDQQTTVSITVSGTKIITSWVDPLTKVPTALWNHNLATDYGGQLSGRACIYGVYAGVKAPSAPTPPFGSFPNACLGGGNTEVLNFEPDGSVSWAGKDIDNAGMTVVLADERAGSGTLANASLIQVYPGGLVQVIHGVRP